MEVNSVLQHARETYGSKNQILVCIEELNELACVLAKYPRYEEEQKARIDLHDSVLDEVADVMIILDHIQSIFELSDKEIYSRVLAKVGRLERWLKESNSMQQTIEDRAVSPSCESCCHDTSKIVAKKGFIPEVHMERCNMCKQAESTEGIKPFYKQKKV